MRLEPQRFILRDYEKSDNMIYFKLKAIRR